MSLVTQAAHLNNSGIMALINGNHQGAVDLLKHSIQVFKQALAANNKQRSSTTFTRHDDHDKDNASNHHRRAIAANINGQESLIEVPCLYNCANVVFNNAFIIPATRATVLNDNGEHETAEQSSVNEIELNLYSAVVIFNLALAYQASSCHTVYASKAEKLYCMVLRLLDDDTCRHIRIAFLMKLASMSHLAHIRYYTGFPNGAREQMRRLTYFVRRMTSQAAVLQEPAVQGLLLNALVLKEPPAAAAA